MHVTDIINRLPIYTSKKEKHFFAISKNRFLKASLLIFFISFIYSCSTIPKESVLLSQELGKSILSSKDGYTKIVNQKFMAARHKIHGKRKKAIKKYITDYVTLVEKTGEKFVLDHKSIPLIIEGIDKINDIASINLDSLENSRIAITSKITKNFDSMVEANATLTGLLQSAVNVKDAAQTGLQTVVKAAGSGIELGDVFATVDKWVITAGKHSDKAKDAKEKGDELYKKVKEFLDRRKK